MQSDSNQLSFQTLKFNKENTIFLRPEYLVKQYGLPKEYTVYVLNENRIKATDSITLDHLLCKDLIFQDFHIISCSPDLLLKTQSRVLYIICKAKDLQEYVRKYLEEQHKEQAKFIAELLK